MAKNLMTPEQDLLTREFYSTVANDSTLFPSNPVLQRNLVSTCLTLLNYDYISGCYVEKAQARTRGLQGEVRVTCEWATDAQRAMEAVDESDSSGEDETYSSEPPKDSEVRETILREDL